MLFMAYQYRDLILGTVPYKITKNSITLNGGFHTLSTGMWKAHADCLPNLTGYVFNAYEPYVTYKEVSEIKDEKYFFIINLHNTNYFHDNYRIGLKSLPEKTIKDCRENRAKIVIYMSTEGLSGNYRHKQDFFVIQKWIDEVNIPSEHVYYITGNLLADQFKKDHPQIKYRLHGMTSQEIWNDIFRFPKTIAQFKPIDDKHLYVNLNRMPRTHRLYFLAELINANLFDKGLNSFNLGSHRATAYVVNYDSNLLPAAEKLDSIKKQLVDKDNTPNLAADINVSLYERVFVSITTETIIDDGLLFFSEKVWKPLIVGHPFMLIGPKNGLAKLKEWGFKTFDRWFDESYDTAPTLKEKLTIITNNLKRYENKTVEELAAIRKEMDEICLHNKELMKERTKNKFYVGNEYIYYKPLLDFLITELENWN